MTTHLTPLPTNPNPLVANHVGTLPDGTVLRVRTYADHTVTVEPLDADGRGTGELVLTAEGVGA